MDTILPNETLETRAPRSLSASPMDSIETSEIHSPKSLSFSTLEDKSQAVAKARFSDVIVTETGSCATDSVLLHSRSKCSTEDDPQPKKEDNIRPSAHGNHSIRPRSDFMFPNGRGDTPLHVAARAGQLDTVKRLIGPGPDHESRKRKDINEVAMKNDKGNIALHEALEYKHEDVARFLAEAHPKLFYLPNNEGKTPEYLAAEAGLLQLLEDLWDSAGNDFIHPQCEAMTALHAAIIRRHRDCVRLVLRLKSKLIRVTDSKGRNPLHYAASIGYYEGLKELLEIDAQAAYQPDIFGHYPIHEAASAGHIKVIKLFLEFCPDSWALPGKGGQSILHVGVQSGKENVVSYTLKTQVFETLINHLDANGNTPLHLATKGSHFKVVRVLTSDKRVNMSICNNDNLDGSRYCGEKHSQGRVA